jgi:hypothetical protein
MIAARSERGEVYAEEGREGIDLPEAPEWMKCGRAERGECDGDGGIELCFVVVEERVDVVVLGVSFELKSEVREDRVEEMRRAKENV